ncbi:MAG: tripartite tricarboxylate transporter substrate binding protein [Comamonadaceae bacterium]|jgi:tripartite-type tricarboxylate transporter receptor subunit TctC|nr:tripartite tricarboxylate transporter substrate binding protein [Comamonadaceae bacterium]
MKFFRTLCLIASALAASAALAQSYPTKPVKVIVPYAAGGTGDILARLISQELTRQTGQSFVVENRTGAGGMIGYGAGAKSAGDGYTLVAMDSSYTMFPGLYGERVNWNIETDLIPVSMYGRAAFALAVNPAKNYKGAEDLVRTAKEKPGAVSFGTPGMGTLHHVFTSLLLTTTGTQMTHVPFRGASEALNAVLGNNVDWTFVAMPTITGQLSNERLRVIAVTSENRSPLIPNAPTLREAGIPMTVANWFGLGAPKGTPPEVVAFLHKQVVDALKSPEVAARMKAMGAEVVGNTPQEFANIMRADLRIWTQVIKDAGIKN